MALESAGPESRKATSERWPLLELRPKTGAGKESRTLDLNLGKVALYQLSYSRMGLKNLEREKSLELSTSTLARLRSTN